MTRILVRIQLPVGSPGYYFPVSEKNQAGQARRAERERGE